MKINLLPLVKKAFLNGRLLLAFFIPLLLALPAQSSSILVLGDSLSAGYGIQLTEAWPSLLNLKLQKSDNPQHRKYTVLNASISGETTAGGLQRLGALLKEHQPDIVMIELGANDGLRGLSLAAMQNNLKSIVTKSAKQGAHPVVIGMRLPPNYGPYALQFQSTYQRVAKEHKVPLIPFLLEGLADNSKYFQADGLHPTREAQALILDNIWPTLQPMLQ